MTDCSCGLGMTPAEQALQSIAWAQQMVAAERAALMSEQGRRILAGQIQEQGGLAPGADVQKFITQGVGEKPAVSTLFGGKTLWIVGGIAAAWLLFGRGR